MNNIDVIREVRELKNQLSYSKNIGFFMGAGTSCALGLPNIAQLTIRVEENLSEEALVLFKKIKGDLEQRKLPEDVISIEDILNQIRRIREITNERSDSNFLDISGVDAKNLDVEICRKIYNELTEKEAAASLNVPSYFLLG